MDDDEALKRNTDCVYFLASPLTCKKGSECEYRHSESARLNPRDCWFWLEGNCLNPSCSFRHPPLDGMLETLSDTVSSQPLPSLSMNKINVACHFYFNGFCIKGGSCPFLHGPDEILPTWKPRTASANAGSDPAENKTSTVSDVAANSVETAPYPTGNTAKTVNLQIHQTVVQQEALRAKTVNPQIHPIVVQQEAPRAKTVNLQIHQTVVQQEALRAKTVNPQIHPIVVQQEAPRAKTVNPQIHPTVIQQEDPLIELMGQNPSPEASIPDGDVVATKSSESPPPSVGFVDGGSVLCPDESSEDQGNNGVEHEEWWESSPGFDVLVDDGSEQLGHEEHARYLENHLIQYEYEDTIGFDHMDYVDGIIYKHGIYDSYDQFEEYPSDHARIVPEDFRDRVLQPRFFENRQMFDWESEGEHRRGLDLRNHLRKRRMMDGDHFLHRSKKPLPCGNNRDHYRRHDMGVPIRGRLASEVEKNLIGSHSKGLKENGRGWPRQTQSRLASRQREKERRRRRNAKSGKLCSEISKVPPVNEAKPTPVSLTFTGPKTLAQIKEEKKKSMGDGSKGHRTSQNLARVEVGNVHRVVSKDFQGPKPLSELLKHKNKPHRINDEVGKETRPNLKEHMHNHDGKPARSFDHFQGPLERQQGNGHSDEDAQMGKCGISNHFLETEHGFLYEDNDDDDEFAKKLGLMFA